MYNLQVHKFLSITNGESQNWPELIRKNFVNLQNEEFCVEYIKDNADKLSTNTNEPISTESKDLLNIIRKLRKIIFFLRKNRYNYLFFRIKRRNFKKYNSVFNRDFFKC